jgi:transposase
MDLVPGGARGNLTAKRAAALLATVTPAGAPAVTRWQLAADLIVDVRHLEQRIAAVEARSNTAVARSNTSLVQLFGVGPVLAATFLGEVGDVGRFPTKHHLPPKPAPPRLRPQRPGGPASAVTGQGPQAQPCPCT